MSVCTYVYVFTYVHVQMLSCLTWADVALARCAGVALEGVMLVILAPHSKRACVASKLPAIAATCRGDILPFCITLWLEHHAMLHVLLTAFDKKYDLVRAKAVGSTLLSRGLHYRLEEPACVHACQKHFISAPNTINVKIHFIVIIIKSNEYVCWQERRRKRAEWTVLGIEALEQLMTAACMHVHCMFP